MSVRGGWARAVLVASLLASTARAQTSVSQGDEAMAAQFFRAGLAAYDRHEYQAAALAFEEAYRHAPRGAAIYNAARGWEAAGEPARAADAFRTAIASGDLSANDEDYARQHLAPLEATLGMVDVRGPATATLTVDGTERGNLPLELHAAPGSHALRARRRDGSVVDQTVTVALGQTTPVSFEDVPAPVAPAPAAPAAPPPPARRGPPVVAWITLGAAATLGAVGAVTYVEFADQRSAFDQTADESSSLHSSAEAFRTATYVAWGTGAACAIAGAVLLVLDGSRAHASSPLVVGPGGIAGTF